VKPLRLLIVTQYFWPEVFRINELVADLVRRGHSVTVLTGKPNYPKGRIFSDYAANPGAFFRFEGADVVRLPIITRGGGRGFRLAANYLSFALSALIVGTWKLRGRPFDAIFVYQPSPITVALPAIALGRLKQAPVTLWVLDLWPETLRAMGIVKRGKVYDLLERMTRWIFLGCDLVLGQSHRITEAIRARTGASVRAGYFPAWSDQVFDNAKHVVPAQEVPTRHDCFTLVFAGNIGVAQDFPAILDAAARLHHRKDIRWVIIGDGRMASWLENQINSRNLAEQFFFVGHHPLERMPEFFAHADALLVSLKADDLFAMTVPGKLQAYLAAGIPVLAMLNGEGAEILATSGAGLSCPAGDSEGLARIIEDLARMDPATRREMGNRGRRYSSEEFDFHTLVSRLEQALDNPAHIKL
jgi:colanic acid biosynthesis glycosyl transferase WcaI